MVITFVFSQNPINYYRVQLRCFNLANAINQTGWHKTHLLDLNSFIQNTAAAQEICNASDIIIIHQFLFGPVLQTIQYWKAREKKIIVDIDEAVNLTPPDTARYDFWKKGNLKQDYLEELGLTSSTIEPPPLEQFKWGMRLVDAATVSSNLLIHDWERYTRVYYVPDYINCDKYLGTAQKQHEGIWIGFRDDQINPASLCKSGLAKALERICSRRSDIHIFISNLSIRLYEDLNVPKERLIIFPNVSIEGTPFLMNNIDLGLAPAAGDFDQRMSWIRVLEYMVMKIPWIASDQLPYKELSYYGHLVPNSPYAWEMVILEMIDHMDVFRSEAAKEPYLFALSQDINENIFKVLSIYDSILTSR